MIIFKIFLRLLFCIGMLLALGLAVSAQETKSNCEKWRQYPQNVVPIVYLVSRDSKVILESGRAYLSDKGEFKPTVVLRNGSNKSIRGVRLNVWHIGGGGQGWAPMALPGGLRPNRTVTLGGVQCIDAPILTTNELTRMKVPKDRIASVVVISLQEVIFEDGSILSDDGLSDRFWEYSNGIFIEKSN